MKIVYFSISLLLTSVFLNSCDVSNTKEDDYSQSATENQVILFVKNGTVSSDIEFKILNNSSRKIFIPFIQYPPCSFSFYSLEKKNNSKWESLYYIEDENRWIKKEVQDTILAICERYVPPLELKPYESIVKKISGFSVKGEYRLNVNFSFSLPTNSDNIYYKLLVKYFVE